MSYEIRNIFQTCSAGKRRGKEFTNPIRFKLARSPWLL